MTRSLAAVLAFMTAHSAALAQERTQDRTIGCKTKLALEEFIKEYNAAPEIVIPEEIIARMGHDSDGLKPCDYHVFVTVGTQEKIGETIVKKSRMKVVRASVVAILKKSGIRKPERFHDRYMLVD